MIRKTIVLDTVRLDCVMFGNPDNTSVIVETSLAGSIGEWFHIAEELSKTHYVILYSRAGYGKSSTSTLDRSLGNIITELNELIQNVCGDKKVIMVGHSFGGLITQAFVKTYPEKVIKSVFIDPMTFQDSKFRENLTKEEYQMSGIDKSQTLKFGKNITMLRLGFIFKPLIKSSPPFYYYKQFSKIAEKEILHNSTSYKMYKNAIEEYNLAHNKIELDKYASKITTNIPIVLFTHESSGMIKDIEHYGGASTEVASKIQQMWQTYMKEVLELSTNTKIVVSTSGSHFLHLTDTKTLIELIKDDKFS